MNQSQHLHQSQLLSQSTTPNPDQKRRVIEANNVTIRDLHSRTRLHIGWLRHCIYLQQHYTILLCQVPDNFIREGDRAATQQIVGLVT